MRAAAELEIATVAVHSSDDAASLHVRSAGEAVALEGAGAAAYLDMAQVVAAAKERGCDAVHPGYGFLAENAEFARRCAAEGMTFVGPSVAALELFGDKARARRLATEQDVPVLPGSAGGGERGGGGGVFPGAGGGGRGGDQGDRGEAGAGGCGWCGRWRSWGRRTRAASRRRGRRSAMRMCSWRS